jgi:chemosensory pili system protein ChpA (sensor histidine kinase/response regulator)
MISLHVLLLRCGGQLLAMPSGALQQIIVPEAEHFNQHNETQSYRHLDHLLHVIDLRDRVGIVHTNEHNAELPRPGLVYRDLGGKEYLLLIDEVLACREVVLKRFGKYLNNARGSLGMTQLSDGQLVCVLDPAQLIDITSSALQPFPQNASATQPTSAKVLVVEDSLSTRRALQQLIGDAGYDVRAAKDGIEALETITLWQPNAILTDLEMPRLNGLELTAQIRNGNHRDLPIIMLTSRSTHKHRAQAERLGVQAYLTKPFSDTDVLVQLETVLERRA